MVKNIQFEYVGAEKIVIGVRARMGSSLLEDISHQSECSRGYDMIFQDGVIVDNNKIYIVLIRNILDKWRSGYRQELRDNPNWSVEMEHLMGAGHFIGGFQNDRPETKKFLEIMTLLHNPEGSYVPIATLNPPWWMFNEHASFWRWNNTNDLQLGIYMQHPNVYFLELKDLSNPKFLQWLIETDEKWEGVDEVISNLPSGDGRKSATPDNFWPQMDIFWEEYNSGNILKDKYLVSPFSNDISDGNADNPITFIFSGLVEQEQYSVDYIRKNHERYLTYG